MLILQKLPALLFFLFYSMPSCSLQIKNDSHVCNFFHSRYLHFTIMKKCNHFVNHITPLPCYAQFSTNKLKEERKQDRKEQQFNLSCSLANFQSPIPGEFKPPKSY